MKLVNTTIGDSPLVISDGNYSSKYPKKDEFLAEGVPFISANNLKDGRVVWENMKFISHNQHATLKKGHLQRGDVLLVTRGSLGLSAYVSNEFVGANINAQLVLLRADDKTIDSRYLYFVVSSQPFFDSVISFSSGTAQPQLPVGALKKIPFSYPDITTQRKIAGVLSAYDDLIENNTRRIAILEEMAQGIYREWFVNFRFPGHEKVKLINSPLGKIPEGWEVLPVGDVIETFGGGTPSTKESEYWDNGTVTWYSPTDLTKAGAMFIGSSEKKISDVGLRNSSAKLFPAYSVMMTSRATIGVVSISTTEACTNQGFITCVPNARLSTLMIYFWLHEQKEKILSVASGATFKEISRGTFRKLPILIPAQPLRQAFDDAAAPITKTIENLLKKQANLKVTRDLLLPKLISGQLDVEELDIETGDPLVEATK